MAFANAKLAARRQIAMQGLSFGACNVESETQDWNLAWAAETFKEPSLFLDVRMAALKRPILKDE